MLSGFVNLNALSTKINPNEASMPFDKNRSGFVMGEGAGILILENLDHALKRNAKIYGEIVGYGSTCDAYHMISPDPKGNGAFKSMTQAIKDADIVVVSYGISARTSLWPVTMAQQEGLRVGFLRLITVWPFPEERIRELSKQVRAFVVPEINMGQMVREVERCTAGRAGVYPVNRPGGDMLEAEQVLKVIRKAAAQPNPPV